MSVKVAEKEITIESLQQQLQLKQSQLNALLEISQAINNNLSADGLMQLYANVLRDEMGINKMAIYTHYDNWDCSICYGLDMKLRSENIFSELKRGLDSKPGSRGFSAVYM